MASQDRTAAGRARLGVACATLTFMVLATAAGAAGVRPRVLVHGNVESPVFDRLRDEVEVIRSSAAADAASFDAVLFDGDHLSPQAIASDPVLRRAHRADRWIIGLDLTEDHKHQGLAGLTGAANASGSRAYMVRQTTTARGDGNSWVVELARDESPEDRFLRLRWGHLADDPEDLPGAPDAGAVASTIASYLLGRVALPEIVEDQAIPPGLISKKYIFSYNISRKLPRPAHSKGEQTATLAGSVVYRVFLDNNQNPQGDFQFVAFSVDGLANPKGGERRIATDRERERAWLQALIDVSVEPIGGNSGDFDFVATAPANRNGETSYTTDASFNVDFKVPSGLSSSFTWGTSQSYTISDWVALSRSSGIEGTWDFASRNPGRGLADNFLTCGAGWLRVCFLQSGLPNKPNSLNTNALAFHAEQAWKTRAVLNQTVAFSFSTFARLLDVFCGAYSPGACFGGEGVRTTSLGVGESHLINLGVVVPVPIRSLTFDPSPVAAGKPATGTIELAVPAPTNVVVELGSNSTNATVLPTVTVKQGDTKATFEVLTNANGLGPGQTTVATITAFYAMDKQAQLTVTAPR